MKQFFQNKKFNDEAKAIIAYSIRVIDRYKRQGYRLSLRQLYYQLVSQNVVPNTEKSYNKVGGIIADARMAGLVDWDMIEDRNRHTIVPSHWDNPAQIIEAAANGYRIDKWADQPNYCEVMVEKQALEGVLEPVCNELDIPFTSNKGYSSVTLLHRTGQKLKEIFRERCKKKGLWRREWSKAKRQNIECAKWMVAERYADRDGHSSLTLTGKAINEGWPRIIVFYLGDHDPSGIDMTRDVADRLRTFSDYTPIEVRRLALNMTQIRELRPPENPAKLTDSRARKYVEQFGRSSWELDAVEPSALAELVRRGVASVRDEALWYQAVQRENEERTKLRKIVDDLKK